MWRPQIQLRRPTSADVDLLWRWRTDPQTVAGMFGPPPPDYEHHETWFACALTDPHIYMWIGYRVAGMLDPDDISDTATEEPVGIVRFDEHATLAEVSVTAAPDMRGHGYGTALIEAGTAKMFQETGIDRVVAKVKDDNSGSLVAFLKAGYDIKDVHADVVELERRR